MMIVETPERRKWISSKARVYSDRRAGVAKGSPAYETSTATEYVYLNTPRKTELHSQKLPRLYLSFLHNMERGPASPSVILSDIAPADVSVPCSVVCVSLLASSSVGCNCNYQSPAPVQFRLHKPYSAGPMVAKLYLLLSLSLCFCSGILWDRSELRGGGVYVKLRVGVQYVTGCRSRMKFLVQIASS
jgi:hypothetical protein